MIQVIDVAEGRPVERDTNGAFLVRDQREYLLLAESPLVGVEGLLRVQPISEDRRATLRFDNYVGLAEIAGHRFRIRHSKLTSEAFDAMLEGVVADVADLAFDFASPTALPFEREHVATASGEVLYHALAYLRHVMRRVDHGEALLGQFLQIAQHPHRKMDPKARCRPVERAANVGPVGLMAIVSNPERLIPIPPGSNLAQTGLGRQLGQRRPLFPAEVLLQERAETYDTHENRLIKHVLELARDVVAAFEVKNLVNPELAADVRVMREEIDWMLSFDFLRDVGPMQIVPSQSSVLQRREGYREFLGHYIRLSQSSILAADRNRWHALLDLKNSALLYEIWCFFEVKRVLDGLLGRPEAASLVDTTEQRRKVKSSAGLVYRGGQVELAYNLSYSRRSESYSVTLRPDIVVRACRSSGWEALILDAKLKFDGAKLDAREEQDPDEWDREVKKEDLYKMHTYRDAIREAVGAFVLYPGSKLATYPEVIGGPSYAGIGAIPLEPRKGSEPLRAILGSFLEVSAA